MASYILTTGTDSMVGAAGVTDNFFVAGAGRLVGSDTIVGGAGALLDQLTIQASLTLAAAAFANVTGIERLVITAGGGAAVTLADAMAVASDFATFTVIGGNGGDTVSGAGVAGKALVLNGNAGNDSLVGGGGNDLLDPGSGADTIDAGAGNDTITASLAFLDAGDVLDGGAGTDVLRLTTAGGILPAGLTLRGIERIEVAPALATALLFQLPADLAPSDGATVTVAGAAGNDNIGATASAASVVLLGGAGTDRLTGGQAGDLLLGGADADTLTGYHGNDTLEGEAGADRLLGGIGHDLLLGGANDDRLSGGSGNDTLDAGTGGDITDGGTGNDWYRFDSADFTLADLVADEDGTLDVLEFTGAAALPIMGALAQRIMGVERILLGGGNDTLAISNDMSDTAAGTMMTVQGGAGADSISAASVVSIGTLRRFQLLGGDGADTLVGGQGGDTLDGGAGIARLLGGAGDDTLIAPADMLAASVVNGGDGFADVLRLTGASSLVAGDFAGVTGIEILELGPEGGQVAIGAALYAGMSNVVLDFTLRGGAGEDYIDTTGLAAGADILIEAGAGDDTVIGGAADETVVAGSGIDEFYLGTGIDRVRFGAGELTLLDRVVADQGVAGDMLEVTLAAGRTLAASAFAGVQGIDTFLFTGAAGAAVRLPSNLVAPSGLTSVLVDVTGDEGIVLDGRSVTGRMQMSGGDGGDTILGGSAADTFSSSGGEDVVIGGNGGDTISLGAGGTDRDLALITNITDGTVDINGTLTALALAEADRVVGLAYEGNYIAVDWQALGLDNSTTLVISAGQDVELGWGAIRFGATETIAANNFGSLTAVRNTVGSRITNNDAGVNERIMLVIGGADGEQFGVYLFEDRDNNATVDVADGLYLFAIGDTGVPIGLGPGRGFTMTTVEDLF